jgi:hypothetical protein
MRLLAAHLTSALRIQFAVSFAQMTSSAWGPSAFPLCQVSSCTCGWALTLACLDRSRFAHDVWCTIYASTVLASSLVLSQPSSASHLVDRLGHHPRWRAGARGSIHCLTADANPSCSLLAVTQWARALTS